MQNVCMGILLAAFATPFFGNAGTIDRVAVVVGNQVITESEVDEEVRVTQFENQEPLDLSPGKRREAAERLVDQQLIRSEMRLENVAEPTARDANGAMETFRRKHFASEAQLQAALQKYGITRAQLAQHLLWQLAAVSFVDLRFRSLALPAQPGAAPPASGSDELDAWLKEARSQTRIEFKKEAFQ
jgi:parvulin-like peptidyl-prolyl isomerase